MHLKFNQVTWYSRLASYLFIFGIFPVIVFVVGKKYEETVMVLSYAQSSAYDIHATGTYEATAYTGPGSLKAERDIVGHWVRVDDSRYTLEVKAINTFYDLYRDKIVASGSWLFRDVLPVEASALDSENLNKNSNLFFQKNLLDRHNNEKVMYYRVISIENDTLILHDLSSKEDLTFIKVQQ